MVWICISLMANEVEDLFLCLLTIYFFCGEMSTKVFVYLAYVSFCFKLHNCLYLNTSLLSDIWFINIFCSPVVCLFTFLMITFCLNFLSFVPSSTSLHWTLLSFRIGLFLFYCWSYFLVFIIIFFQTFFYHRILPILITQFDSHGQQF